jgi:hypothetical protein
MTTETLPQLNLEKLILVNQDGSIMAVNKRDTEPAMRPKDNVIKYQNVYYILGEKGRTAEQSSAVPSTPKNKGVEVYEYFARVKKR